MQPRRINLIAVIILMSIPRLLTGQEVVVQTDSARIEIRAVLRAFYLYLENQNWEALSPYVLSPKLLERRGGPGNVQTATKDRARERGLVPCGLYGEEMPGAALGFD